MAIAAYSCGDDILCGVNLPEDIDNMSEFEQKHFPVICAPDSVKKDETICISVEVGNLKDHPNEPGHFIEWLELYCGETFLFRTGFSGSLSSPSVTIPVKLAHAEGPLKAYAKCNLHGLWESAKGIVVEE